MQRKILFIYVDIFVLYIYKEVDNDGKKYKYQLLCIHIGESSMKAKNAKETKEKKRQNKIAKKKANNDRKKKLKKEKKYAAAVAKGECLLDLHMRLYMNT
jgi:uncharacterized membrane-anchored protein YhcB (DUF1043 family)